MNYPLMTEFTLDATGDFRLPRGIRLRPGTQEDEAPTFDVMRRAMGFDMLWTQHAAMRHHLRQSPDCSYWIAEETPRFGRPRIIGYARSIVRDHVWSLTEFFLLPDHHRRGIGRALLERCLADGAKAGADTRMVLASHNLSADALYIRRAGCLPRVPMMLMAGPAFRLRVSEMQERTILDRLLPDAGAFSEDVSISLYAEPVRIETSVQSELDALDRAVVGYARPQEHAFWAQQMGGERGAARIFRRREADGSAGAIVGYAYQGNHCGGPVLAGNPSDLPRMMAHVAQIAHRSRHSRDEFGFSTQIESYCAVAGTNATALRWLLDCGWKISFHYLFMSSRPFGQLDRYICHNPLYVM
jgi:GNAT superfamily N-acetyltransferase